MLVSQDGFFIWLRSSDTRHLLSSDGAAVADIPVVSVLI